MRAGHLSHRQFSVHNLRNEICVKFVLRSTLLAGFISGKKVQVTSDGFE